MCGRFQMGIEFQKLLERYKIFKDTDIDLNFKPRNEIFPSNEVPVIVDDENRQLSMMKWGFSPSYSKKLLINARSETVDVKPTFKSSFYNRRCIIPANGFYEWKKENGEKIKHRIYVGKNRIFSMAGIYNKFIDKKGNIFAAFTILTTSANDTMKSIHHRMPVIIGEEDEKIWLDSDCEDIGLIKDLLKPYEKEISIEKVELQEQLTLPIDK